MKREDLLKLGFLAGLGYVAYRLGLIGKAERVKKVASKLELICPRTICRDKTNECKIVYVPDDNYSKVLVFAYAKRSDGNYDQLLYKELDGVVKGQEYDVPLSFIGNDYVELDVWVQTGYENAYGSKPVIKHIRPVSCASQPSPQPPSSPKEKPSPQPQPPSTLACESMSSSNPCVDKVTNQLYSNATELYKWDSSGHIEFDVDIPPGCRCCFDVDAYVERDGRYWFERVTTIGPYTGHQSIALDVQLPDGTKDIKIWPRCSGKPSTPSPPRPSEPCTARLVDANAYYDHSKNAVVASATVELHSNCYNCNCVAKVFAVSEETGARRQVVECFTAYGHAKRCSDSFTVYGSDYPHGSDTIRFELYVNDVLVDTKEVRVEW